MNRDKTYSPIEDVDDSSVHRVIAFVAKEMGISTSELWRRIGVKNITTFSADYPGFFKEDINIYTI